MGSRMLVRTLRAFLSSSVVDTAGSDRWDEIHEERSVVDGVEVSESRQLYAAGLHASGTHTFHSVYPPANSRPCFVSPLIASLQHISHPMMRTCNTSSPLLPHRQHPVFNPQISSTKKLPPQDELPTSAPANAPRITPAQSAQHSRMHAANWTDRSSAHSSRSGHACLPKSPPVRM